MKQFRKILVKVNKQEEPGEDIACKRAIEIARETNAKIILFDVVESSSTVLSAYEDFMGPDELTSLLVDRRVIQLQDLADEYKSDGLNVSVHVAKGKNFIEIVKAVIRTDSDLLIKVANPTQNSFDSNDFHIMRKCPKPVWLIKSSKPTGVSKVAAAVDLSMEEHDEGRAVNRMILGIANSLCKSNGAKLSVVSCWSLYGEQALRHGAFTRLSSTEVESLLKKEEDEYQKIFERLLEECDASNAEKVLMKGSPKTLIPSFVNTNDIDTVVMGTMGRSGISGFLIGNTSESVLQAIDSSVITLKPSDFESPVA